MTIIGIDPGASGGIAVRKKGSLDKTVRMPDQLTDLKDYFNWIRDTSPEGVLVFVEKVQMFMSDSDEENKGKQFRIQAMLKNYNELIAMITFYGFEYVEVYPVSWQSYLGYKRTTGVERTDRKNEYKEGAMLCFPSLKVTLWNADALLILKFGLLKLEKDINWVNERRKNTRSTGLF